MDKEVFYKTINTNGIYTCGDIGISTKEWVKLLNQEKAQQYIEVLLYFLRESEHKGTCRNMGVKYGKTPQHYNSKIKSFSEWVQKELGRFRVIGTDGKPTYWCITMKYGRNTQYGFEWQLRDELVEALRIYLMRKLIEKYKHTGQYADASQKSKWALIEDTKKTLIEFIQILINNHIIDNEEANTIFQYLIVNKAPDFANFLENLINESISLDERITIFKKEIHEIYPNKIEDDTSIEYIVTTILFWKYPEKYTIFDTHIYLLLCQYFGLEYHKDGNKIKYFIDFINNNVTDFSSEILSLADNSSNKIHSRPLLNLTLLTLFQNMKENMENELNNNKVNYWLVGVTINDESKIENFLSEGIWVSIYHNDNSNDQKLLKLAKSIKQGDIIILKSTATKGANHSTPFLRIKGFGFVKGNTNFIQTNSTIECKCNVEYISKTEHDFDGAPFGAYRKTIHLVDEKNQPIIDYVNSFITPQEPRPVFQYQQYIELLKESYNLVLTGAPGTGKTYMAQAIAQEMGCGKEDMCFVQFHPSYDYTDFVEGLRPVESNDGQIGFERKDGIFKDFCKKAAKNLIDSNKTVENLTKEISWEEQLQQFIEDAIENNTKYQLSNGNEFIIEEIKGRTIIVRNNQNEKTALVSVSANDIIEILTNDVQLHIVRDIRNYFNRKFGTQPDSYAFIIIKEIRKKKKSKPMTPISKINRKDYVFIIDEINRGEASKIFGELFYAIDPGYRGKSEIRVKTQYQNLVPEDDPFSEGFYVPENVYILATMNDIDRSIESMDFAMRRRFTWQEISPTDTESMLDELECADEAKAAMHRLNKAIEETDGLGSAYAIGGSYFLKLRNNGGDMKKLWNNSIQPLLKEYLRGFRKTEYLLDKFRTAYFSQTEEQETSELDEI